MLTCASGAFAQGTITWNNRQVGVVDWRVADQFGAFLDVSGYTAQLYVGADAGSVAATTISSTFRTGAAAGYFTSLGDVQVDGFAAGANVAIQVRAWDNAGGTINSWDAATVRGESSIINVTLGGAGSPPSIAANLSGFGTDGSAAFQLAVVPEPSTFALGALGIGALLMVRRRQA